MPIWHLKQPVSGKRKMNTRNARIGTGNGHVSLFARHMDTKQEFDHLRSHLVTANRGGRRYPPYAFTEQGIAMLSSVLRSTRAVQVNIEIMRAFVQLRQMLTGHADLARKLAALEKKYDTQFKIVFDVIRELMTPPEPKKKRPIGFAPWKDQ